MQNPVVVSVNFLFFLLCRTFSIFFFTIASAVLSYFLKFLIEGPDVGSSSCFTISVFLMQVDAKSCDLKRLPNLKIVSMSHCL
jgi:hypothetical protein